MSVNTNNVSTSTTTNAADSSWLPNVDEFMSMLSQGASNAASATAVLVNHASITGKAMSMAYTATREQGQLDADARINELVANAVKFAIGK